MNLLLKIILVVAIWAFVGCAGSVNNSIFTTLQNQEFQIKSITLKESNKQIKAPEDAHTPTLAFDENSRIYGNAGCNRYSALINTKEDNDICKEKGCNRAFVVDISQALSTKMLCASNEANEFEFQYLKNLNGQFNVEIYDIDIILDSRDDKGMIIFLKYANNKNASEDSKYFENDDEDDVEE